MLSRRSILKAIAGLVAAPASLMGRRSSAASTRLPRFGKQITVTHGEGYRLVAGETYPPIVVETFGCLIIERGAIVYDVTAQHGAKIVILGCGEEFGQDERAKFVWQHGSEKPIYLPVFTGAVGPQVVRDLNSVQLRSFIACQIAAQS